MKIVLTIVTLFITIYCNAQDNKTVTLVVSGQGKTQENAKQAALRSAIEQAFGAFISSKTEILNDDLVKDEIVSVANGNIQKFEVISEVQIPNGDYTTSLRATVSILKLTSFVESKGIVVEFNGNLLAVNLKQQTLNEQNEIKSIGNIVNTCKEFLDLSCNFNIIRGMPKQKNAEFNTWAIPITINVNFNENINLFNQYFINSINGLCMSAEEISQYNELGKNTYKIVLGGFSNDSTKVKTIYHFRTKSTVIQITDLIYYTKHSALNFQISNGIKIFTPERLVADHKREGTPIGYNFKIVYDNLNPIFNSRKDFGNLQFTSNAPAGILGLFDRNGYHWTNVSIYEPISTYNNNFYYNGRINRDIRSNDLELKYAFLNRADKELPSEIIGKNNEDERGYYTVISLYDYKADSNKFVSFCFDDILSLQGLEKVNEYKISPISNRNQNTNKIEFPKRPNPPRLVNDYTKTLTSAQVNILEDRLAKYATETSSQIAIVLVETTSNLPMSSYANELFNEWGIGTKEKNNGVLLCIAIKDRTLQISTGSGIESILTNKECENIINNSIVPYFKIGNYFLGIDNGVNSILKAIN
jgi:hypothetical protein